jgi:hypothetical protein
MNPFRRNTRDDRDATEFLDSVRPADWDARAIEFTGASDVGLPDDETAAVTPEWWRP